MASAQVMVHVTVGDTVLAPTQVLLTDKVCTVVAKIRQKNNLPENEVGLTLSKDGFALDCGKTLNEQNPPISRIQDGYHLSGIIYQRQTICDDNVVHMWKETVAELQALKELVRVQREEIDAHEVVLTEFNRQIRIRPSRWYKMAYPGKQVWVIPKNNNPTDGSEPVVLAPISTLLALNEAFRKSLVDQTVGQDVEVFVVAANEDPRPMEVAFENDGSEPLSKNGESHVDNNRNSSFQLMMVDVVRVMLKVPGSATSGSKWYERYAIVGWEGMQFDETLQTTVPRKVELLYDGSLCPIDENFYMTFAVDCVIPTRANLANA